MKIFNQAITAHQEGKLEDAERLYREILKTYPTHPGANHNLGLIESARNKLEVALPLFKKATEVNPNIEQYWISYINILIKQNQFEEAEIISRKAIKHKSESPKIHFSLAVILNKLGKLEEAEACFKKAIQLRPDYHPAYNNLGATLQDLDRSEEAEINYRKAIELEPNYAHAHNNLGIALKALGRLDEAEVSFKKAIALKPDFITIKNIINNGDWELSKELLEKMCIKNIIDTKRNVEEFISLWCVYCRNLLSQDNVKKFTQIFTKLLSIGKRNKELNNLINYFFSSFDINKALELVELNDKILIKVSYCQYKFATEDFIQSETLAASNIKEAKSLIQFAETEDIGWLVVRRSLPLFKRKDSARKNLNDLIVNLGLAK